MSVPVSVPALGSVTPRPRGAGRPLSTAVVPVVGTAWRGFAQYSAPGQTEYDGQAGDSVKQVQTQADLQEGQQAGSDASASVHACGITRTHHSAASAAPPLLTRVASNILDCLD